LDTFKELRQSKTRISFNLNNKLMLVHSFILAKRLIKLQDHLGAARLLVRVSNNISQFPSNVANILTSTVAECVKSGLKEAAFNWSCVLARPEHRNNIPEAFKKRVMNIARHPVTEQDGPDNVTPCPYCRFEIPDYLLDCPKCKNFLPFCVASGKHMTLQSWSQCPECKLPCRYESMRKVLENDPTCPMCNKVVPPDNLRISSDPEADFKTLTALMKDSGPEQDDQAEDGH